MSSWDINEPIKPTNDGNERLRYQTDISDSVLCVAVSVGAGPPRERECWLVSVLELHL